MTSEVPAGDPDPAPDARHGMSHARFLVLLETYGARVERWPAFARIPARAWMDDPQCAGAVAEARALDGLLGKEPAATATEAQVSAVLAQGLAQPARFDWRPLAALAACAVFGVVLGLGYGGALATQALEEGGDPIAWASGLLDAGDEG